MTQRRSRLVRDLAGELDEVMKADSPEDLLRAQLPLLQICADSVATTPEQATLDYLISAAIKHVKQPNHQRALARLFSGDDRFEPLAKRGPSAAAELGISYDGLRRRNKDGQRRLDTLMMELAEAISSLAPLEELVGGSMAARSQPDPGENAFDRASVFLSYARSDDEHEGGLVSNLRDALISEFRFQTGQDLFVFHDKTNIDLGENWRRKLEENLDTTSFLLVVLTPSYMKSAACREELQRFLQRERDQGRDDLVLPVYYATLPTEASHDKMAQALLERQYVDWRNLRFYDFDSTNVRIAIAELASAISVAMARSKAQLGPTTIRREDESRPGLIERLGEMELALPRFVRTLVAMTTEQEGITEEVQEASVEVDRLNRMGRGGAARVIVARRLSSKLEPYANRMEECASDMRSDFEAIGHGMDALARALPHSDEENAEETAVALLRAIREALDTSIQARSSLEDMLTSYSEVASTASTLRPVLNRLSGAVRVVAECPDKLDAWAETLANALELRREIHLSSDESSP